MSEQHSRSQARYLVGVMDRADNESMVLELARLTANRANGGRESQLIVGELITALARMLHSAAGPSTPEQLGYELQMMDDDQVVDIDQTSPPVRASVRALLAQLNEHSEDALFQVDLALREASFQATLEVFTHVLLWTIGMLEWCDTNNVPRPRWLGAMVSTRRAGRED